MGSGLAAALAALALGAAPAAGQVAVQCSDPADALATDVTIPRQVQGARAAVYVEPKEGRTAAVTGLTVAAGGRVTPLPAPGPGTITRATIRLPEAPRATVTFRWVQSEELGYSQACRGEDAYAFELGPSAVQLRAYLGRMARTQRIWAQRREAVRGVLRLLREADIEGATSEADVFARARAFGRAALQTLPHQRRLAADYARAVRRVQPPSGLRQEHLGLAASAAPSVESFGRLLAAFASVRTLAEITRARRADEGSDRRVARLRGDWRIAVTGAAREAGLSVPRWVSRVGRT